MRSIMMSERGVCYLCQKRTQTEYHHVFNGQPNRKRSEQYGLTVYLCPACHNSSPDSVHQNQETDDFLKADTQKKAMEYYGWTVDDFRAIFGKSWL